MQQCSIGMTRKTMIFKMSEQDLLLDIIDIEKPPLPTAISNYKDSVQKELDDSWITEFAKHHSAFQKQDNRGSQDTMNYNDFLHLSLHLLRNHQTRLGVVPISKVEKDKSPQECSESDESSGSSNNILVCYSTPDCSLLDCLRYSPYKIAENPSSLLYVTYQILYWTQEFHSRSVPHAALKLDNIFINEDFTIQLGLPNLNRVYELASEEDPVDNNSRSVFSLESSDSKSLAEVTENWILGQISNFDYLMFLNKLAGRRMNDPNHHPMLPWVTDFSVENAGWRDLNKSKFRLNKGDTQLDHQFLSSSEPELSPHSMSTDFNGFNTVESAVARNFKVGDLIHGESYVSGALIPHHVSDAMCDITYYSYKARCTPIEVLCRHVRPQWRPQEYPSSMERMYQWTPDECIPELYTDPSIFKSIHADMNDLALPKWCNNEEDFLSYHRRMLESDKVSQNLHKWIDITFGYKLLGEDAVQAKNVYLELVDKHKTLRNYGVTFLFSVPHPRKCPAQCNRYFAPERPLLFDDLTNNQNETNNSTDDDTANNISLPADYDPLELLSRLSEYYTFIHHTTHSPPPPLPPPKAVKLPILQRLLREDILSVACLIVELFLFDRISPEQSFLPVWPHRFRICYTVAKENWASLPSSVTLALDVIFSAIPQESLSFSAESISPIESFHYLPNPSHLLYLHCSFPTYLHSLNHLVNFITGITLNGRVPCVRSRIDRFSDFLHRHGHSMPKCALRLLIPHLIGLMSNSDTQVPAACKLFPQFGCLVGRHIICEEVLPTLLTIYSSENQPEGYHELYAQHFLAQVLLHVGLKHFLAHLPHLLVQAISGCKDAASQNRTSEQHKSTTMEDTRSQLSKIKASEMHRLSISSMEDTLRQELICSDRHVPATRPNSILSNSQNPIYLDSTDACLAHLQDDLYADTNSSYLQTPSLTLYDMHTVSTMRNRFSGSKDSLVPTGLSPEPGDSISNCSGGSSSSLKVIQDNRPKTVSYPENKNILLSCSNENGAAYGSSAPCDSRLDNLVSINTDLSSTLLDPTMHWSPVKSGRSTSQLDKKGPTDSGHGTPVKKAQSRAALHKLMVPPTSAIISDIAGDSVLWLSEKLGPVLCSQYFSRNLLRMLVLCYSSKQHLTPHPHLKESPLPMPVQTSKKILNGDLYAAKPLLCLKKIACLYGISMLTGQYLPFIKDCVEAGKKELTSGKTEGGLVASLVLLQQLVTYLPDRHLMDCLHEPILKEVLMNVIRLSSSFNVFFPSGAVGRRALLYKCIDVMYVLGLRLGFESTRSHMTEVFRRFFASFGRVHFKPSCQTDANCSQYLEEDDNEAEKCITIHTEVNTGLESRLSEYYLIQMTPGSKEVVIDTPSSFTVPQKTSRKSIDESTNRATFDMEDSITKSISRQCFMEEVSEELQQEMRDTFTPEIAHLAYVPFCRLAGGIHMDTHLFNSDLIHSLVSEHEKSQQSVPLDRRTSLISNSAVSSPAHKSRISASSSDSPEMSDTASYQMENSRPDSQIIGVSTTGNSLSRLNTSWGNRSRHSTNAEEESSLVRCQDLEDDRSGRHLVNNWASYWSHEIGLNEKSKSFDVKQVKLLSLSGHMGTVRHLSCLDTENSLLSCGKDKTVRLWSLNNSGYSGSGSSQHSGSSGGGLFSSADPSSIKARFVYQKHRKSVFSAHFLETLRMVASCDGSLHLWDALTGKQLTSTEPGSGRAPLSVLSRTPAPHCTLIAGDTDNHLHVIDPRTGSLIHRMAFGAGGAGYNVAFSTYGLSGAPVSQAAAPALGGPGGSLRHLAVSPCGNIVICAFLGGYLTAIDRRIGCVLRSWRGHMDDINQVKFYSNDWFITTSQDNAVTMWNSHNFTNHSLIGHPNEPIHCLDLYRNEIVLASPSNRIAVYRDVNNYVSIGKLSPSLLKTMLTSFVILPLNRLMAAGSDNGSIVLFC